MSKRKTSNKGILFVVSAPSGAGKTTVVQKLLRSMRGVSKTISHTTRQRRKGERQGRDYHFVSKKKFQNLLKRKKFLEWTSVYGNLYGTSLKTIRSAVKKGDVILVIEVKGAKAIRKKFKNAVFVAILPPSMRELERRIMGRHGKRTPDLARRMKSARKEIKGLHWYDHSIVNRRIPKSVSDLKAIIRVERMRTS